MSETEKSAAKKFIEADNNQEDLIAAGFQRLDPELLVRRPPKIQWGVLYKAFNDREKITYLQDLANSMNHAARLIQEERNDLLSKCDKKDGQLESMKSAMQQNMNMLQAEITRMNEDRRQTNKAIADLNKRVRELTKLNTELLEENTKLKTTQGPYR